MSIANKMNELIQESGLAIYGGVIVSAGKFEGQKSEILYFYDLALNGMFDRSGYLDRSEQEDIETLELTDAEREYFQTTATHYQLAYHDLGFVSGQFL